MELEKIKKCPFCGKIPNVLENFPIDDLYTLTCEYRECTVKPYTVGRTKEEMITRWNIRISEIKPMDAKSDLVRCIKKLQKLKNLKEKEPNNSYHDWEKEIVQCEHNIAECVIEMRWN